MTPHQVSAVPQAGPYEPNWKDEPEPRKEQVVELTRRRRTLILLVLSLLSALNYYDRYVIIILIEDIKHEFQLSDTQIGAITGIAFALVYSFASLPIARYADTGRHGRVISISALLWSIMAGACGAAVGFWSLLIARLGIGLGESGAAPATQALIARTFSERRRASALGVIGLAGALGSYAAISAGGLVAHNFGWRYAFLVGAIAGIPFSLLAMRVLRDGAPSPRTAGAGFADLFGALRVLAGRRSLVWVCGGLSVGCIGSYGTHTWSAAYFMRHFQLNAEQVGATYSASIGISSVVGMALGGVVGDWLSRRGTRGIVYLLAGCFAAVGLLNVAMFMTDSYTAAILLSIPIGTLSLLWAAPLYALVQILAGRRLGATGAAISSISIVLIGQGFGPLIVGWLSDTLAQSFGEDGLRYALMIISGTFLLAPVAFVLGARTVVEDAAKAASE